MPTTARPNGHTKGVQNLPTVTHWPGARLGPPTLLAIPGSPRPGGIHCPPPCPLIKETAGDTQEGPHSWRRREGGRGMAAGHHPGSLHTQGGFWTKTSCPGKSGPCAHTCPFLGSPAPRRPSLQTPCSQASPHCPQLWGLRGASRAGGWAVGVLLCLCFYEARVGLGWGLCSQGTPALHAPPAPQGLALGTHPSEGTLGRVKTCP